MFTTPRKIWNRLMRRTAPTKRLRHHRLPLRMESLEGREVPATLYGLTEAPNQQLLIFNSATPNAAVALNISGLTAGESLVGIDFRPANEQLYGISNVNSKVYTINTGTGAVSLVGSFGVMPVATSFGLDFNPVVDKIRYTGDTGVNLRIDPNTGGLTANDPGINGATTGLNAIAYTNNFQGATSTQLFGINSATDQLFLVTNPNAGSTVLVGNLGVDTDDRLEMDIAADDGICYATLTIGGTAKLYTIDTATGVATEVGKIGIGTALVGIAAQPVLNNNPVVTFSGVAQKYDIQTDVPALIDPAAKVQDPDTTNFNTGTLSVSLVAGIAGDVISIQNQGTGAGQVSISGTNVLFQGVIVGMFTNGSDVLPLSVTFNNNATLTAVQAVLRAATFATSDNSLVPPTRMFNATVTDGAGGAGATPTPQTVILGDFNAPTVVSINRDNTNPTNATMVAYTVIFSEDVTGVDMTDFQAIFTGVASASVGMVTQNTPSNYTVIVNVGTGMSGTVRLDALADGSIIDTSGNKMIAGFMGQTYDIDRIAPIVVVSVPLTQPNPAFSQPVTFLVDFSEPVTGFDTSKITLSGTALGMLTPVINFLGGTMYEVEVSGATSDGTIVLSLVDGAGVDAAGNASEPFFNFGNSIFVNVVNDAPVITAPASVTTIEDTEFAFTGANTVSVADSDLNNGEIEITLTAVSGMVRLGDTTNLTFSVGDGSLATTMTFKGLLADVNAALTTLFFNPDANFTGLAQVTVDANDLGNTGSGGPQISTATIDVNVDPVNDGPTITFDFGGGTGFVAVEDTVFNFPANSIVIGDIDAGANDIEVTLTVTNGTLTFGDITGLSFTVGDGTADATMTFRGTVAAINAALNTLTYLGNANFNGLDSLTVFVDDLGNSGTGGPLTATDTAPIDVTAVNDAPTVTAPAAVNVDEDTDFAFTGANTVSVADVDDPASLVEITLTATNGTIRLTQIAGLTFSVGDGSAATTMTFEGSLADVNAALATLIFRGDLNFNGLATVTIQASDVTDPALTNSATVDVTVDPVNDAPTITFNNTPFTTAEDTTFNFTAGSVVISDVDGTTGEYEVTLAVTNGTLTLGTITGLTFTTGDGTDDVTMTFKGTLADINAALDTLSFAPTADFNGTAVLTVTANDQGNTGSGGPLTTTQNADITVTAVNDGPTITAPAAVSTDEDVQLVFSGANLISITDGDAGTGSLQVTLIVTNGLLTLSGITGLTFTTGDGTSDAKMVFTGKLADINNALNNLKYNPNLNFNGSDTLSINVDDQGNSGSGGNKTAMQDVAITVNPINDAPTAVNSSFTTKQNEPLVVNPPGILTGATDPEGVPLSAILVTDVPAGTGVLTFTGGNGTGNGGFTFVPAPNFVGVVTFQFRASDGTLQSNIATVTITVTENFTRLFATGAGEGGGPQVVAYNPDSSIRFSFYAFEESFAGGVRVATGDVNGDGVEDIICAAGPGGTSHIRVFSGKNLAQIHSFIAYDPNFTGGAFVGAGDVNGDGFSDVIVGAGEGGGPHVRVFSGKNGQVIQDFFAYDPNFFGGVSVASADYNGDGRSDIVTGAGPGGTPHVLVYGALSSAILRSFFAFDTNFAGGVNVAAGAFNDDPAIFVAAKAGGVPVVSIFDFETTTQQAAFFAFDQSQGTGVSIATEVQSNGRTTIFVGSGPDFAPTFRALNADTLAEEDNFNAYSPEWLGGVYVG